MYFSPFVIQVNTGNIVPVTIDPAGKEDLDATHGVPTWQTDWTSEYLGIGELLIAYGIKYSIDHGCRGDVVFDAKTDALARHYELDFHAKRIPTTEFGGPKRYMLADEDAWRLFSKYLTEGEP